jgi:hypothetical protein
MSGRDALYQNSRLFEPSTETRSEHHLPMDVALNVSLMTQ